MESRVPLIRLEVEGMKHAIVHAFSNLRLETDQYVQQALEKYCSPEHLSLVIERNVSAALDEAIREEVNDFFQPGGAGRSLIAQRVKKKLEQTISS